MSFNKGYTPTGFAAEVFHLHLRCFGDNDEIYFCAYLKGHTEAAREYELLKLRLWKLYEFDGDAYTSGKGNFVQLYTAMVKSRYRHLEKVYQL